MARQMDTMTISYRVSGTLKNVLADGTGPSINHPNFSFSRSSTVITNGIDSNQANRAWQSTGRTLAAGTSVTLDLYDLAGEDIGAGAGMDGLGQPITFEEIVAIVIVNENAVDTDGALEIAPAAVGGWTPIGTHTVASGGALYGQGLLIKQQLDGRGFDVQDGVSHRITLTANGGDVKYSIYLLARHDDEESSSSSSFSSLSSSSSSSSP